MTIFAFSSESTASSSRSDSASIRITITFPQPPRLKAVDHQYDVVIIGAGPSGSATAFWLAEAGHNVLLIEKKNFPREKTCGDGLTPRSVKQLQDMGLGDILTQHHRFDG